jgi:hypothetical protein
MKKLFTKVVIIVVMMGLNASISPLYAAGKVEFVGKEKVQMSSEYGLLVIGIVQNNTNRTIELVKIYADFFNGDGVKVSNDVQWVENLEPGQKGQYIMRSRNGSATRYKMVKIVEGL